MAYGLNNVARSGFALCTNHCCTLGNAAKCLVKVLCATNERNFELVFVDVVNIVGRRKHFALVDVVYLDGLQNLSLGKVADAALGHHGDRNGLLDALNHLGVAHTRNATSCANVGRDTFQCHNGACARSLGNACLLGGCNVHDNTAFKHLCQVAVQFLSVLFHFDLLF